MGISCGKELYFESCSSEARRYANNSNSVAARPEIDVFMHLDSFNQAITIADLKEFHIDACFSFIFGDL